MRLPTHSPLRPLSVQPNSWLKKASVLPTEIRWALCTCEITSFGVSQMQRDKFAVSKRPACAEP
jgi:NADH:ubiquinone oxidoreductase subunit B-like Fe-S oxidoreductase